MEIKKTIAVIKNKIRSLFIDIADFCKENRTLAALIGLISFLLVLLILLLIFSVKNANSQKETALPKETLELTEEILLPEKTEQEDKYILSRTDSEKWTETEAKEWFHVPGDKEIESLSKNNDRLINELLQATP